MEADCDLDEPLIVDPRRSGRFPPEVFPPLVGIKIAALVKTDDPLLEKVIQTFDPLKYLIPWVSDEDESIR